MQETGIFLNTGREVELANALALSGNGIEVHFDKKSVTVSTLYEPFIQVKRLNLFNALFGTAKEIMDACAKSERLAKICEPTLEAFKQYDYHSHCMQV